MRVLIDETANALAYAHSLCRTREDENDDIYPDTRQNDNLVLWTDASVPPQNQAGLPLDRNLLMLGSRKIHYAELVAILYALRIALRVCKKKKRTDANKAGELLLHPPQSPPFRIVKGHWELLEWHAFKIEPESPDPHSPEPHKRGQLPLEHVPVYGQSDPAGSDRNVSNMASSDLYFLDSSWGRNVK